MDSSKWLIKHQEFKNKILDTSKFIESCKDTLCEFKRRLFDYESFQMKSSEALSAIDKFEIKIRRSTKKIVLVGKTSAGKSSIANALIGKKYLATGYGITSRHLIEIVGVSDRGDDGKESHFIIQDTKRPLSELESLSTSNEFSPSTVQLVLCGGESPLLLDGHTTVYDTPGIDAEVEMDKLVAERCYDADVVIIVLSGMTTLDLTDRNLLLAKMGLFQRFNVHLVFTFWDIVSNRNGSDKVRLQHLKVARDFLVDQLRVPECEVQHRVHFVCSRWPVSTGGADAGWLENSNFIGLKTIIESEMQESARERQEGYMRQCYDIVMNLWSDIEVYLVVVMQDKLHFTQFLSSFEWSERGVEIRNCLEEIGDISEAINRDLRPSLDRLFESMLDNGEQFMRQPHLQVTVIEDSNEQPPWENLNFIRRLHLIIEEDMENLFEGIHSKILDALKSRVENEERHKLCIDLIEHLYFPWYLYPETEVLIFPYGLAEDKFKKIVKILDTPINGIVSLFRRIQDTKTPIKRLLVNGCAAEVDQLKKFWNELELRIRGSQQRFRQDSTKLANLLDQFYQLRNQMGELRCQPICEDK